VLSDILGDEDHLGDMDFKVAGTADGITALQMDIKIDGITEEIMKVALAQAKRGRLHILGEMAKALTARAPNRASTPRASITIKIPTGQDPRSDRQGRRTIREITEETGATIDIDDDGTVIIASVNREAGARRRSASSRSFPTSSRAASTKARSPS
jgi:polyribonucleotide nucleotidyltransferase